MPTHSKHCYVEPKKQENSIFSVEGFFSHNLWAIIVAFALFIAGYSVVNFRIDDFAKRIEKLENNSHDQELALINLANRCGFDVSSVKGITTKLQK